VLKIRHYAKPQTVSGNGVATVQPSNDSVKNGQTKCQRFAKFKELKCHPQADPNCSTFNFAQPHPKPTHHPTIRTIDSFGKVIVTEQQKFLDTMF
jgi:hypothetical protein